MGIFNKELTLLAPVSGRTLPLEEVPDPVFAQKLTGDGAAIEAKGNVAVAPADGEVVMIFKTNHAYALRLDNGLEILVHIGVDTVKLNGNGFKRLIDEGEKVKAGTPIIGFDADIIKEGGFSCITPVLITNMEVTKSMKAVFNSEVTHGIDAIIYYKIK